VHADRLRKLEWVFCVRHHRDGEFGHRKRVAEIKHKAWERDYTAVLRKSPKADPPYRPDEIPTAPACRRFITNDATKEKLQAILGENPGGLLSYQDELAGWFRQLDSLGHEGEKHFFMEMWNGTRHTVDRIG
jgi:hypothetical protein